MCEVGGGADKSCCISLDNYNLKSFKSYTHVNILEGIAAQRQFISFNNIFNASMSHKL